MTGENGERKRRRRGGGGGMQKGPCENLVVCFLLIKTQVRWELIQRSVSVMVEEVEGGHIPGTEGLK